MAKQKKGSPGYIALVLDQPTQEFLSSVSVLEHKRATHATLAFRPTPEVFDKYKHLIGMELEVALTELCCNGKVQAARVTGLPSENRFPHVTISHANGTAPVESNDMISTGMYNSYPLSYKGKGVVQWVSF